MAEMTESELHAVMTGGFATIAGSVFGLYISFGKLRSTVIVAFNQNIPRETKTTNKQTNQLTNVAFVTIIRY
jgi:nucleoside permease NupC